MDFLPDLFPVPAPDEPLDFALGELYGELRRINKPHELRSRDAMPEREMPKDVPTVPSGYTLVKKIGEGGFGQVYPQPLLMALTPAICTALGVWLGSRNGRKVRLKIGDIEAEAQTQEQVEKLIARAREIQLEILKRNQPPKVIP